MPAHVPEEVPSHWVGYIHVADIDGSLDVVKAAGGQILFPVMGVPNVGRFTQLRDPSGAVVALMTSAPMWQAARLPDGCRQHRVEDPGGRGSCAMPSSRV